LLIGFWFLKQSAISAGKKAFITTRLGDLGFTVGILLLFWTFHSVDFTTIFKQAAGMPVEGFWPAGVLTGISLLLFIGAIGKSAQIPLYVWLPDAMEGPTPVSALIHAATMVTAGVYMVVRSHVLFDRSPFTLGVIAIIGAATALFAATVGMVQTDIKRVLAYSTISQLGYMFLACGAAAYSAAIFHLVTHAFFKALLFLAAGSVIHALGGQQDMRAMGGLRKTIPITFWTMSAAVFAISGLPPFSGFFSKDAILYQAFLSPTAGPILWFVGLVTALLTAFYMFRLWYLTFFGESRSHEVHPHESPWSMLAPLVILAVLAVAGGWIGIPRALGGGDQFAKFLEPVVKDAALVTPEGSVNQERLFSVLSVVMALIGWFVADLFYRRKPGMADRVVARIGGLYTLLVNKYWIDQVYNAVIVAPLLFASRYLLWGAFDRGLVNGGGSMAAGGVRGLGALVQRVQSGNIRSYAGWLALGAAALLLLTFFGFSMHL
jgi:NADH-quinone oxidoreductase subunit L